MTDVKRMIVGVSGASCAMLAVMLLDAMRAVPGWEAHLVLSSGARRTIEHETPLTCAQVEALAHTVHDLRDVGAAIASGTFRSQGMVVVPCSMKTLSGIANGYSENLLLRAADVVLKERRKLVLAVRETPLSLIHLRNMTTLATMGAVILPLMMTCYNHPKSVEDMLGHMVGKIMAEFGLEAPGFRRWGEQP